jgi:PAS domain S-box-containing protein
MSAGENGGLPLHEFGELMPWSFIIDAELRLTHLGNSLARHVPSIQPGDSFASHFTVTRPRSEVSTYADLAALAGRLIVLEVSGLHAPLRASITAGSDGGYCVIGATPLIRSQAELAGAGLGISDFQPYDSLPDLLFALQARDVATEEASQSSLRQEEASGRLKSILDSALDAMITIDMEGYVVEFNDVATVMFGYDRSHAIGCDLAELIIPTDQREQHRAGMAHFRRTGEGPILNQRLEVEAMRSDGHQFPVELAVIPFEFAGERYVTATIRDLTHEHAQKRAIEAAAEKERLLHRELDHRVKNMLAQILVLCRKAENKATVDGSVIASLSARIHNISAVHELLSRTRATGIEFIELARLCLRPHTTLDAEAVTLSGPPCRLVPRAAMTLAMVLNELATNAAKYGAIKHQGTISLHWSIDESEPATFQLHWEEQHDGGMPESLVGGFGMQILNAAISYELAGEVTMSAGPKGVHYSASIPLDHALHRA